MGILSNNPFVGLGTKGTGYQINQSLRFDGSARFSKTFASDGNRKTFTISFWVKNTTTTIGNIFNQSRTNLRLNTTNAAFVLNAGYGSTNAFLTSNASFRDPSAWYHFVLAFDTTQSTASDRVKIWVNNQLQTYSSATYPPQNQDLDYNSTNTAYIGAENTSEYLNGYLAEYYSIDGTALTPSSFGETDTITGAWIPKKYSGSFGTNGFYLQFQASGIGTDSSGNGNNWTANNFSTSGTGTDVMSDTPTNNWCTLNPLNQDSAFTLSDGNLRLTSTANTSSVGVTSTSAVSSGKWYWEVTRDSWNINCGTGLITTSSPRSSAVTGSSGKGVTYLGTNIYKDGSSVQSGLSQTVDGDVIGIALDLDSNTVQFYKNNSAIGTAVSISAETWTPSFGMDTGGYGANVTTTFNFGQRSFSYTPPSNFKALCTANLPEPTIKKGGAHFNTVLYTGTGSTQSISGVGFQPDFVWIKKRSATENHELQDAVRGATKRLASNVTDVEVTVAGSISSFNTDGFTVVDAGTTNELNYTYVAWNWDANGAGSSNTAGTITSTVSANASAGFSIVTYTGTGTAGTVGHGLGVAPRFVIVRKRSGGTMGGGYSDWLVYSQAAVDAGKGSDAFLYLNTTGNTSNSSSVFGSAPTSTIFNIGNNQIINNSGSLFVAYCFSEVAGYSKFGYYAASGQTFVYTGFAPAFVMIKALESANWVIFDRKRSPYNKADDQLSPNTSGIEVTNDGDLDFLSNGFKLLSGAATTNAYTYVYAAFAELPFKYANAR